MLIEVPVAQLFPFLKLTFVAVVLVFFLFWRAVQIGLVLKMYVEGVPRAILGPIVLSMLSMCLQADLSRRRWATSH